EGGRKSLAVGAAEEAAHADPGDDPLDEREFGEKQLPAGHGAPGDGSMIGQVAGGAHSRAGTGLGPGRPSARAGLATGDHARTRRATGVPGDARAALE